MLDCPAEPDLRDTNTLGPGAVQESAAFLAEVSMASGMNRRTFLKTTAAAGFGVWIADRALAQESKSPAENLNVAVVAVQGQGKANLKGVKHQNVVALCDVDSKNLAGVVKEFPELEKAKQYADWRKMLEQKDIDAVVISTPDHVHAHA